MPIYGRALNPRVYGPSPDTPPDDYNYLWSFIYQSDGSLTPNIYYVPETNWYRIWVIGRGGSGGKGGNGYSDRTGGSGGGGGHGGTGYADIFLEEGTEINSSRRGTSIPSIILTLPSTTFSMTATDGTSGSGGSGMQPGNYGNNGDFTWNGFNGIKLFPQYASSGSNGGGVSEGTESGPSGGRGGYFPTPPGTKYSYSWNTSNPTPPNLNLGNGGEGGQGGDGGDRSTNGRKGQSKTPGGVIIEIGIYNS